MLTILVSEGTDICSDCYSELKYNGMSFDGKIALYICKCNTNFWFYQGKFSGVYTVGK